MSSELLFSEILEEFDAAQGKNEKIAVLRKHDHPRFRDFFYCLFNKNIEFDVETWIDRNGHKRVVERKHTFCFGQGELKKASK